MIKNSVRIVAAVGAAATLVMPTAWADNLVADGDGIGPVANSALSFGTVCTGEAVVKPVLLAAHRDGNSANNTFKNSTTATMSVLSTSSQALRATVPAAPDNQVLLPSDWERKENGRTSGAVTASVRLNAPSTTGTFNGSVDLQVSGTASNNTSLTKPVTLPVSANVVNCAPQDTTAPQLSLPGNIIGEATGATGRVVTYSASATDANPDSPTVTCTPASDSTFAIGSTTVSCSATDAAGNTATGSFTVAVRDTTSPVLTNVPSDITEEATSSAGAAVPFTTPTATDAVGAGPVSCAKGVTATSTGTPVASGDTFPLGTTTVTCSSSDAAGNRGTASFNVAVQDTTAPDLGQITAPDAAEATGSSGAVVTFTNPTATDAVGAGSVTCTPASGSTFPLGTTPVTCESSDAAGNRGTASFDVTVQDTTRPVLVVPDDTTEEATSAAGAAVIYSASADDLVDGPITPDCSPASGSTFGLGPATTVGCSATDAAGNIANDSFTVTVLDRTPPVLSEMSDLNPEATSSAGAPVTFTAPTATDAVGAGPVSCAKGVTATSTGTPVASGDTFPLGTTTVTCSSSDAAGNRGIETFDVTVRDTTAPALAAKSNVSAEATSAQGASVTYAAPAATDAVDASVDVNCTPASDSTFALGTTAVACTATDDAGNSSSSQFNVTVVDTTAPALTLPADQRLDATSVNGAPATYTGSAQDAVSGTLPVTCNPASGSTFAIGTTSVNCSATDAAGNTATGSFSIKVQRTLKGFYQPVDMWRTLNTVKNGATVPLKFEVFAGGTELTSTDIIKPISVRSMDCNTLAASDEIEVTTSGSTSLRYDSTSGQYIYNWQTPKQAGTCYLVTVTTVDGAQQNAQFKLR